MVNKKRSVITLLVLLQLQVLQGICQHKPDVVHGHLIAPQHVFFNTDCSKAVTVGMADIVLWDLSSGQPITRIDIANNIREFNPFTTTLKQRALASPDLSQVMIELYSGNSKNGFLFDLKTAKLSTDDKMYNDVLYAFTKEGDYQIFGSLRKDGVNPNPKLQVMLKPDGSNMHIAVAELADFAPVGFSTDGGIIYGKDRKTDKFIIYDPQTKKTIPTKLKYNSKDKFYFYFFEDNLYTSKWLSRAPKGSEWEDMYYHIETEKLIKFNRAFPAQGPYTFSDNGNYGVYFDKAGDKFEIVIKDMESGKDLHRIPSPENSFYAFQARLPGNGNETIYMLTGNGKKILVYNIKNAIVTRSIDVMVNDKTIELNKDGRQQLTGAKEIENEAKAEFDVKNFLVNFPPITHFSFNLSTSMNLKGHDITNLPFTQQHYTASLGSDIKVKSVLGLGNIADCNGGNIILGVVRAVVKNEDRTMFFIDHLDAAGKSLKFENIGLMSKAVGRVQFFATLDLGVYVANKKAAIVMEQRYHEGTKTYKTVKKTLMIDQTTCSITEKK